MNYLQEIVDFSIWKETQQMTPGAIALWYELMAVCNRTGWREEFSVSNTLLMAKTGLTLKQFQRARALLVESGRIGYQKAVHSSEAGAYRLIAFDRKQEAKIPVRRDKQAANAVAKCPSTGSNQDRSGTNAYAMGDIGGGLVKAGERATLYKQNKTKLASYRDTPRGFASLMVGLTD